MCSLLPFHPPIPTIFTAPTTGPMCIHRQTIKERVSPTQSKLTSKRERYLILTAVSMELRRLAHLSLLLVLPLACAAASSVSATKFTVGDAKAWNPNVNYTVWVNKHKPFYVGDWLVFYYTSGMADVVQVDEAAYNKCDSSHPISNYSKGRSYAFELNHSKTYYFICSFGYCYQGMKLAIKAQPLPPPSPPPSSKPSAAPAVAPSSAAAVVFAAAALIRLLFV